MGWTNPLTKKVALVIELVPTTYLAGSVRWILFSTVSKKKKKKKKKNY